MRLVRRALMFWEIFVLVRTVAIQLVLFLLPFVAYAIYRLLVTDAQSEGRKTWPINALFAIGAVLALSGWTYLALNNGDSRGSCVEPARVEDGVIIPAKTVPCERDLRGVGRPNTDSPGRAAQGVSDPEGPRLTPREIVPDRDRPEDEPASEPGDGR